MFYSVGSGAREVVAKPPGMKNLVKLVGKDSAVSLWRDYYAAITASAASGSLVVDGASGGEVAPLRRSFSSVAAKFRKASWRGAVAPSSASAVTSSVGSRMSSVVSLASEDASMQVVNLKVQAQQPGYCYLYAVSVEKMVEVAQHLGPEPEFRRLVALPVNYFESFAVLQSLAVEKHGTRLDVSTVTRSGVTRFLTLCRSLRGDFPSDSLAVSVLSNYSACTAEFVNSEKCTVGIRSAVGDGCDGIKQVVRAAGVPSGWATGGLTSAQASVGSSLASQSVVGVLADDGKYRLLSGRAASSFRGCTSDFRSGAALLVVPCEPVSDAVASSLRGDQDALGMKEFFLSAWRDPLVRMAARNSAMLGEAVVGRPAGVEGLDGCQLEAGLDPPGFVYAFHLALHGSVPHLHIDVVGGASELEASARGQVLASGGEEQALFHSGHDVSGLRRASASANAAHVAG